VIVIIITNTRLHHALIAARVERTEVDLYPIPHVVHPTIICTNALPPPTVLLSLSTAPAA
jgi:hypothetical protein